MSSRDTSFPWRRCCWSALLIHLTGGRIETHFHVFGSLAFLAFYRDWRVLIPATVVVAADHLLRGLYFPQSVYGVLARQRLAVAGARGWVDLRRRVPHRLLRARAEGNARDRPARGRPGSGQGGCRGRQPGQERVPRQHEPRDPHADERRDRHDRPAARHGTERAPAPLRHAREVIRRLAAGAHQRHPGFLEDRGRQARADESSSICPRRSKTWSRCSPSAAEKKGLVLACHVDPAVRSPVAGRSGPPAAGAGQPRQQRDQVHRNGRGRRPRHLATADAKQRRCPLRRHRHRHRHSGGPPGPAVQELLPGGRVDHAQVRRHRAGAGDLQAAGRADGRADRRRQHAGKGSTFWFTAPVGRVPHARSRLKPSVDPRG